MQQRSRRILIDCSHVDFTQQPTGIPRVVLKYIEVGYEWARRTGIEVIPVTPTQSGLYIRRPLPGRDPPPDLLRAAASEQDTARQSAGAELAHATAYYLAHIVHHLIYLIASLVPMTVTKVLARWLDSVLRRKLKNLVQFIERLPTDTCRIYPREGDVLFTPAYWHDIDPAIYRDIRSAGTKVVVLVHDILPILFDRFYPAPWCYEFKANVTAAFSYADALFCVSDFTRSALIEFGTRQKQTIPPMMTAYNGFEPLVLREVLETSEFKENRFFLLRKHSQEAFGGHFRPFIMVGTIEPKKGHLPTIRCFEAIWRAGHRRNLVIIGRRGWLEQPIVDAIERSAYYEERLFWFSDFDDFDLAQAYSRSHALILSSFGEGFGIPMIEASYFAKPTIALDTPIAREVLGPSGLFFRDGETLIDRVIELEDRVRYQAACASASGLSWGSWDEYTPRVLDELAKVTANPKLLPTSVPLQA
jgi:glycosyltransferase involved in cell wall biosynthesis